MLVRPDHHVAWRAMELPEDPAGELLRAMTAILDRGSEGVSQAKEKVA